MSTPGAKRGATGPAAGMSPKVHWPVALILGALALLMIPSYAMLATTVWASDDQGHGPIILAVTLWLMWQRRDKLMALPDAPAPLAGWVCALVGLVAYAIARSQAVDTMEVLAHLPLIAAALLLTKGWRGLRWGIFFLFFLLFMVPLPGIVVQSITTPLKIAVSHVAESILHEFGYPVARSGVILYVGQFQLMVADACAGLNSIFTLEALGLLYMNLMNHTSVRRNVLLAVSVVPIAFTANVTRVIILVLITYYFGDEAGQGFVHGFAGMVLFMVALMLVLFVDGILGRWLERRDTGGKTDG